MTKSNHSRAVRETSLRYPNSLIWLQSLTGSQRKQEGYSSKTTKCKRRKSYKVWGDSSFFFPPVADISTSYFRYNVTLPLKKTQDLVSYMLGNSQNMGLVSFGCYLNCWTAQSLQQRVGRRQASHLIQLPSQ